MLLYAYTAQNIVASKKCRRIRNWRLDALRLHA